MAVTVVETIVTSKQTTWPERDPEPAAVERVRRYTVTSRWASVLSAEVVRDLAFALDLADAPDEATVRTVLKDGRPCQLVAEWSHTFWETEKSA